MGFIRNVRLIGLLLSVLAIISLAAVTSVPQPAGAMAGDGYDLTWNTIDGGGITLSSGGGYTLGGTIGQADADRMTGGSYGLTGGFWSGIPGYYVFLPFVTRQ